MYHLQEASSHLNRITRDGNLWCSSQKSFFLGVGCSVPEPVGFSKLESFVEPKRNTAYVPTCLVNDRSNSDLKISFFPRWFWITCKFSIIIFLISYHLKVKNLGKKNRFFPFTLGSGSAICLVDPDHWPDKCGSETLSEIHLLTMTHKFPGQGARGGGGGSRDQAEQRRGPGKRGNLQLSI